MPPRRFESRPIRSESDVVAVRQAVRVWAVEMRFSLVDETKLVTAASELARNTLIHGGGGSARMEAVEEGSRQGIRLIFEDQGPGIPDMQLALTDGYSTGQGLGLGLSGSRRLVNQFEITSNVGEGTRVVVTKWK